MNSNTTPLLSIIIPTKNRYTTLLPVVNAILKNIKSNNFELIIQDNSDSNKSVLSFFDNIENTDSRIHYYYHGENISISDNTILAIEKILGKYAIFIGDDDIVSPYICEIVEQLNRKDIDCLIFNCGYYWWDSVTFLKETYYHRKKALWIPENINTHLEEKISEKELSFVIKNGGVHLFNLPRFYHGIIKREVLEKIKSSTGTFLVGSCPDISYATSIAFVIDKYYYINYPVTIYGASKNSGGGYSASNKHYGKIENQTFLKKNILEVWDENIPKIWSAHTIYAQTVSEVLTAFKYNGKINYNAFYGSMLVYEPFLIGYIKPTLKLYCNHNPIKLYSIIITYIKKIVGKLNRDLLYKEKKFNYEVALADNIDICMNILSKYKFNNFDDIET